MSRGQLPALAALEIADDPALWERLGFALEAGGSLVVGAVTLRLAAAATGQGLVSWTLRSAAPLPFEVDGIRTRSAAPGSDDAPIEGESACPGFTHPNGVTGLDHVVVTTPDLYRTLEALCAAGMEVRRERDAGSPERPMRQAFLWAGDVLVEVAGPPQAAGEGPARLWGVVFVTTSFGSLADHAGELIGSVRPAVQPGRQIATLSRDAGSSIPIAFMTPHQRPSESVS